MWWIVILVSAIVAGGCTAFFSSYVDGSDIAGGALVGALTGVLLATVIGLGYGGLGYSLNPENVSYKITEYELSSNGTTSVVISRSTSGPVISYSYISAQGCPITRTERITDDISFEYVEGINKVTIYDSYLTSKAAQGWFVDMSNNKVKFTVSKDAVLNTILLN